VQFYGNRDRCRWCAGLARSWRYGRAAREESGGKIKQVFAIASRNNVNGAEAGHMKAWRDIAEAPS